ncbi:unnamed protein product [Clonostachys solani]|uniref:Uncharacterized protein n=1 Tax=Clonostachys solani TaxID=160281 RepID=A0A9N9YZA4_9HYPO|nr:unnamed protein product [Clonostachys solani]
MMRSLQFLSPALAVVAAAQVPANRLIVEFAETSLLRAENHINATDGINVVQTFESDVFRGASIELDGVTPNDVLALSEVIAIWPNERVELLAPVKQQTAADKNAADKYAVHWATGVEELHKQGIYGEGAKIGIIDTGIWYNHNALGGAFGDGSKVVGGYDFIGDSEWGPGEAKNPDKDPIDQQGHGTHVAGIIAGNSSTGWLGVAPQASLYAYKIFSTGSTTDTATIIEALLRAYTDDVDIITASISGAGGFANNPWAIVATRLVTKGFIITIGAGDSGEDGPFFIGSGGSGDGVIAVASAHVQASKNQTLPSSFTSWGGLFDLSSKPDISAPGTDIFSTWLGEGDSECSFAVLSGTAMATPYVAGVAALWVGNFGNKKSHTALYVKYITMRIINSGKALPWLNYDGTANTAFRAPPQQVGSGLVNAAQVIDQVTSLAYKRFSLNDTDNFQSSQVFTIENTAQVPVVFTFEHSSWAGFEILTDSDLAQPDKTPRIRTREELEPKRFEASVELPKSVTLGKYETRQMEFVFTPPTGLDVSKLPAYGGTISVKSNTTDVLVVPYQGVGFSLKEQFGKHLFTGSYPRLGSASAKNKTSFTFDLSLSAQDFPKIFWSLNWGTTELRFDIYGPGFSAESDWVYPPVVGENNYIGSAAPWTKANNVETFDPSKDDKEDTYTFPLANVNRDAPASDDSVNSVFWLGKLADGTYIQPGTYTIRFGALIPFSDPEDHKSWSTLTQEIQVVNKCKRAVSAA